MSKLRIVSGEVEMGVRRRYLGSAAGILASLPILLAGAQPVRSPIRGRIDPPLEREARPPLNVWAISDLHLGFSTGKWMDPFGDHWKGHHEKVASAWREEIAADDLVLLPGDFSWAMKADEVRQELDWLDALPGRKVLSKGNHDYWWPGSQKKLDELLPDGVIALKKRAAVVGGVPLVAGRGGDFLPREGDDPAKVDEALRRERRELLQSIDHLRQIYDGDRGAICLFHYPPYRLDSNESLFTRILEDAGCEHCVFGHLHNASEWERVFRGERNGVTYHLVSCDALDFRPLLLLRDVDAS